MVGVLRRPYGLKGELVMEVVTDFPERLTKGATVYLGQEHRRATIGQARRHAEGLLIKFQGVDSQEGAAGLRKQVVFVRSADRPELPEGVYYHHELVGFEVVSDEGRPVGRLQEILQTGANDVYVVRTPDGGEVLLPAIASVVLGIDRGGRTIRIHEMPGLMESNVGGTRTRRG